MKYRIGKAGDKFIVLQEGDASPLSTHDTKADAIVAVAALVGSQHGVILCPIVEEGADAKPGSKWAVVVIEEGLSANRTFYPPDVLQRSVKLYESRPVFWNHTRDDSGMRDPRDIAGFLRSPRVAAVEESRKTAIVAVFHATAQSARERLLEAHEAGNPGLYGFSHTALAEYERVKHTDGQAALRVKSIKAVESVDIVSFPSAGGRVMRLVAGLSSPVLATQEELVMLEKKLAKLKESRPDLFAKLGATPTEAEVDALLLEAVQAAPATPPPTPPATPPASPVPDKGANQLSDADRELLREARVRSVMEGRTFGPLQETARGTLQALAALGVTGEALVVEANRHVKAAAEIVEVRGTGSGHGTVTEAQHDEADKLVKGLDGFFWGQDVDKIPRFRSIKEAYIQITGDAHVTGLVKEAKGIARFARLVEGLQSGTWANVLANTLNRALVREYNAAGGAYADDGRGWLYEVVPANDFRTRERVRFGGYGNLTTVAEGNPYPTMTSPTDEKATYAVSKKGGVETLTWEMIRNDDVGAVRRIPQRMAFAARRTFYEFAHDLYRLNPTIYDSVALFHASHGSNLGAAALAAAAFTAARVVMMKQTEKDSAKRLGLVLRHLMIPPDLHETAYNLFVRDTNNDPKFIQDPARPMIHVITHAADVNDWFACAGVDQTPQIEISFLDGREDPEIFVADMPNAGSFFVADKIDYKIRHVYGGAVLDFRGFFGAYGI